jgi:hypothetical protein
VRDLTRDGRWSTYDVSVLKLSNVSFWGKCARMGNTLKIPSPTKLARMGNFPPTRQAGRLAGPVFYVYVFSLSISNCLYICQSAERLNILCSGLGMLVPTTKLFRSCWYWAPSLLVCLNACLSVYLSACLNHRNAKFLWCWYSMLICGCWLRAARKRWILQRLRHKTVFA